MDNLIGNAMKIDFYKASNLPSEVTAVTPERRILRSRAYSRAPACSCYRILGLFIRSFQQTLVVIIPFDHHTSQVTM